MLPALLFETILAGLDIPVVLVDEDLRIVFANRSAGQMLEYEPGIITGQPLIKILNIEAYAVRAGLSRTGIAVLNVLVNINRPVELEGWKKGGGAVNLGVSVREIITPRQHIYSLLFQDLTYRQQAEQFLKDSREILAQSQQMVVDIREYTETQMALRASEMRYRGIIEDQTELICRFDLNGIMTFANEAYCRFFLQWRDSVIGGDFYRIIPDEDRPAVRDRINSLSPLEPVVQVEHRINHPDGETHWMEWTHRAIINPDNQILEIQSVGRDITQRRRSEEELHFRAEFEKLIMTLSTHYINIPVGDIDHEILRALGEVGVYCQVDRCYVFQLDRNQNTISVTHEWCADGINSHTSLLHNQPVGYFAWAIERLESNENIYVPSVSKLPKEASGEKDVLLWLGVESMLAVPLFSGSDLTGFLVFEVVREERTWSQDSIALLKIVSDVIANALQRKKAEIQIRQSEARSRALLSAIPDIMFHLDRRGNVLDYARGEEDLPYAAQLPGQSLDLVLPPEVFSAIVAQIEKTLDTGKVQALEFLLGAREDIRHYEARFVVCAADEVIAIIRNTSEKARLEQMKTDFIHRATHELRTPVTTALLMLSLIQEGGPEEETRQYLEILKGELERQRNLVEDLLTVGRLEDRGLTAVHKSVDLTRVLQGAHASVLPLAQNRQIQISLEIENQLPGLMGDSQALQQAFVNLINNGIKFTPPGGLITVRAVCRGLEVEVSVKDTGVGIPRSDLPNLFQRFFRGRNAIQDEYPGSGIGLYIVRSVVEKMGGTVRVESELGKGSTFVVILPVSGQAGGDSINPL